MDFDYLTFYDFFFFCEIPKFAAWGLASCAVRPKLEGIWIEPLFLVEFIFRAGEASEVKESFLQFEMYVLFIAVCFEGELSATKFGGWFGEVKSIETCFKEK